MTDYSKYYTPEIIATALMKFVDFKNNDSVIDICCGKGNLLSAAYNQNRTLRCLGVDVADVDIGWCKTIKKDGREIPLTTSKKYNVVLANPPFGRIEGKSFSTDLFSGKFSNIKSKRIEIEMLIANLMLLKKNGILLIILPTTFIEGASFQNIRKIISSNYYVKNIIKLPENAFYPEKINCSAIVICNNQNKIKQNCTTYIMDKQFNINISTEISYNDITLGYWNNNNLKKNNFVVNRGNLSSNMFTEIGVPVLHTSKRCSPWKPAERYVKKDYINSNSIIAEKGDIIISRVGCSAGCACVYDGEPKYITDCLLIIKSPTKKLVKQITNLDLKSIVYGVSTPHLTATNLYNLYSDVYMK